jgi:hypothetical protein
MKRDQLHNGLGLLSIKRVCRKSEHELSIAGKTEGIQVVLIFFFYAGPASSILSMVLYKCREGATESVPKRDPNLLKHFRGAISAWLTPKCVGE